MRKREEIVADFKAAEELPELERDTLSGLLFLEVLLDIRELVNNLDSTAIEVAGNTKARE